MTHIQHILFPYDFSSACAQAAGFVKALASQFNANITLYSVVPPLTELALGGLGPRVDNDPSEWQRALQSRLDRALVHDLAGAPVERVAEAGDPVSSILRFADENAVDLIMMPTHGLGLFRAALVGSVTSKVLHDATCPVWTAAHAETQRARRLPKTVLCAVDRGPSTDSLIQWAAEFSEDVGAVLRFVHVVGSITDWLSLGTERTQDQLRHEAHSNIESMLRSAGIDASLSVSVGKIVPTVVEEATRTAADLVIVGRGSMMQPFGRLRAHAVSIIQRAPCPVVSVMDQC